MELVINQLAGWPSVTRLYEHNGDYWIVLAPETAAIERLYLSAIPEGVEAPVGVVSAAPISIFRASVARTPVWEWVNDSDTPQGSEPPSEGLTEDRSERSVTYYVNGVRWGGIHQEQTGETLTVGAIDDNGDPLDGLTPWAVLPPGSGFDDAIAKIEREA